MEDESLIPNFYIPKVGRAFYRIVLSFRWARKGFFIWENNYCY